MKVAQEEYPSKVCHVLMVYVGSIFILFLSAYIALQGCFILGDNEKQQ